ncbi:hypothetical protein EIP91_006002 [Steccherinum ochraceum]|uniref:NAD-dependent epimerase/dehydratase domain-containing protein n=1 Tax=Steccherinum ochraceum TaxID=92696 RepID=A0A4R0RH83_9APHY|nr:hypothetical protein EIP91_006002 [Steccherinum ochraceum]
MAKAEEMRRARPSTAERLEFVVVGDLSAPGGFDEAVKDVDGIIHCAAPVATSFENPEQDVIIPAIEDTKAILTAASKEPSVKRIVITSSFAAVFDISRGWDPSWTYTADQWNPVTYDEAKADHGIGSYRGAKKLSERYAWDYVRDHKPTFDLVTLVPPIVFGPIAHPITKITQLNSSNQDIWAIASGKDYPQQRGPVWVDVRDLAYAHVQALFKLEAGGSRFLVGAPEKFSYQKVADIARSEFDWAKDVVQRGEEGKPLPPSFGFDGETAGKLFGLTYRSFRDSMIDAIKQFKELAHQSG